jgi:hypothetical protein
MQPDADPVVDPASRSAHKGALDFSQHALDLGGRRPIDLRNLPEHHAVP